ncbi:MAG TPA: hypothetical protein EYQ18_23560 [Candidatus Handelsmanbacteria bacterium]|nr:hypothetical protein [Candidatus Handelsmanbacteria bacterium]
MPHRRTAYRAISMYLMAQYFRKKRGLEPDWALADIALILACFASQVAFSIDEEDIGEFEVFFAPYFKEDKS